ncbi:MerR family transcriptional regulator [Nocardiopsis sp. FR4]|uniref:MerR family transcriptional regulator n=1 Tax=Nocardiopsis sp. FR4 TaxID=2605985 RepID=UPI001356BE1E|nr:MerR family transcriptional regulator [Nocardiopsis sp. FR4]
MLPIGAFSQLTGLSAKTLRHYHAHGVLVPARVDGDTGFRWYTVDQVGRAERIAALRRTGLGLDDVRRVVDDPGLAPEVLHRHTRDLERRRREEDRALAAAPAVLAWEPRVRVRPREACTALTAVAGEYGEEYDTARVTADAAALADALTGLAEEHGWGVRGRWWRALEPVAGSGGSRAAVRVCLPVAAAGAPEPPPGVEVAEYGEGRESYLALPGPETLGGYALALSHLFRHEVDGVFPDIGLLRHTDVDGGVEFAMGLRPLE